MKKLFYIATLALLVSFTSCENETPFDTQSPDDAPLILKPYNESGTGSFSYELANPDTPLFDSVTVTPSAYTTVNWYLDGQKIFTGTKINMTLSAGKYALRIEAVTDKGLSTHRDGFVLVHPYDTDPYSEAPASGRHAAPGMTVTISGQNLSKVVEVIISDDIHGKNMLKSVTPSAVTDAELSFTMPEMADGKYYVRLKDSEGKLYGADAIEVHNGSVVLAGAESFEPGAEWVLTGVNLQNVASVKVDETTITDLVATETSITLTAPAAEVGAHKLSILNKDGSNVLIITSEGAVSEATTIVSEEKTIWEGRCELNWGDSNVKLLESELAPAAGKTILVYYERPEAEYYNLRITSDWWGSDLVAQFDVKEDTPNPFTFVYDDRCQGIVASEGGAALIVGFGETITKVTYK